MRRIDLAYSDFKSQVQNRSLSPRCIEVSDRYYITATDGVFELHSDMMKDDADVSDFETNLLPICNRSISTDVVTRYEVDFLTLKLAKMTGQADANGDLVLSLEVPGTLGTVSRYIAGGYASTSNYAFGDAVTGVEVCDDANGTYSGYANATLRTYHDDEVAAANAGWYFWKSHGTEGEVEMEPVGYYGELYAGMVLKVTFKVQANAYINALIWWGKKE